MVDEVRGRPAVALVARSMQNRVGAWRPAHLPQQAVAQRTTPPFRRAMSAEPP